MCWVCHQQQPLEETKRQYLETLKEPKFEVWNMTSMSHLMLSISGVDGYEISDIALELFKNYINWLSEKEPEATESINSLKEMYILLFDKMKEYRDSGVTEEELRKLVTEKMHNQNLPLRK
jgi:hypothetical protein